MDAAFKPFSSIGNVCERVLKALSNYPCYSVGNWVVTEKIHGANFSLTTDGKTVLAGRRQDYLKNDADYEYFFHCKPIIEKYSENVKQLHANYLKKHSSSSVTITVYSEYFGGQYPGTTNVHKPVQKGLWYSPNYEICAFDILVRDDDSKTSKYLDYDEASSLLEEAKIPHSKAIFRGPLDAAIEFSKTTYDTLTSIPKQFGLPDIEDNIREGNVLKPEKEAAFTSGERIILKHKNSRFLEKAKKKNIKLPSELKVPEEIKEKIEDALSYVTESRYDNVASHLGDVCENGSLSFAGDLIDLLFNDALVDWMKDNDIYVVDHYKIEDPNHRKVFEKTIKKRCAQIVLQKLRAV